MEVDTQSAAADPEGAGMATVEADTQSAAADSEEAGDWRVRYGQTRADALMDGVAVAMAHLGDGHAAGADRYLIHLVAEVADSSGLPGGPAELVDGSPLDKEVASRIAWDAS
ncbi:MAG: hypothetical protein ACYCTI_13325, partial [Acidimicrobiales bacterium]